MVIYNGTDDCVNEASAGPALAWCVIAIGNPSNAPSGGKTANTAAAADPPSEFANCVFQPTSGASGPISGVVAMSSVSASSLTVFGAQVTGAGLGSVGHGWHVHTYGDMTVDDASRVGGHFNPLGANHSIPRTGQGLTWHVGDLGNLLSRDGNSLFYNYVLTAPKTWVSSSNIVGRAIVITEELDDCTTPASPVTPIAWCVVGFANPNPVGYTNAPITVPGTATPAPTAGYPDSSACASGPNPFPFPSTCGNGNVPVQAACAKHYFSQVCTLSVPKHNAPPLPPHPTSLTLLACFDSWYHHCCCPPLDHDVPVRGAATQCACFAVDCNLWKRLQLGNHDPLQRRHVR
jgi:Cu/Zn superoxide dismutase